MEDTSQLMKVEDDAVEDASSGDDNSSLTNDEEFYRPPEPDYSKANSLPFQSLCKRMETVWALKKKKISPHQKRVSKDEKLAYLLPKRLIQYLEGGSIYPVLRLIAPDKDTVRPHFGIKEKVIANIWSEALGLSKTSADYRKLVHYTNPIEAGPTACGDLSIAVFEVVEKRFNVTPQHSKSINIGEINVLFDELSAIKTTSSDTQGQNNNRQKQKQRVRWVTKLIAKKLSPLEHKWIVRILLQKMETGLGSDTIISSMHEWAEDIYSANKNIKTLCAILCDKEYIRQRKEHIAQELNAVVNHNRAQHLPKGSEPVVLNCTIAPMLSMRTSFKTFLVDIQKRHKAYVDSLDKDDPIRSNLSLKFPVFNCEVKVDGERILAHIKKGVVKLQTRNSVWYSELYSPILGPALRRAIERYNVDVILDGEVISWDDGRKETIPFGENRSVAKCRMEWCRRQGLIDDRDVGLHDGDHDMNVMSHSSQLNGASTTKMTGEHCWLKFIAFDILYIGGADAQKCISESLHFLKSKPSSAGSILNLDLYQRKCILYQLIQEQENVVEIVDTMVVRPDGNHIDGRDYFSSNGALEEGRNPMLIDSITAILDGDVPDYQVINLKRKGRISDREIDENRAKAIDIFYSEIVTKRCLEGLVFKDLSSPYGLGSRFRNMNYWFKLKDDYDGSGHAADIDVVVLGGSFATGMSSAGFLNKFLVGCIDTDHSHGVKFLTLCTVNGRSTSRENLFKLLRGTGFKPSDNGSNAVEHGKWFESEENAIPEFISDRSFQRSMKGDNNGWKCKKNHYPDLWIRPEDSFVLTLNAGEITSSNEHSAGVTLRFPRITNIRAKNFDCGPKPPSEVESVADLHELFFKRQAQQQETERESQTIDMNLVSDLPLRRNRFFSMGKSLKEGASVRKKRATVQPLKVKAPRIQDVVKFESNVLAGFTFLVLDGVYRFHQDSLEANEAKDGGWFDDAKGTRSQQHVVDFICKHGGKCVISGNHDTDYVVGGQVNDPRVANFQSALDRAFDDNLKNRKSDQYLQKMLQIGGVMKWTSLYAATNRLLQNGREISGPLFRLRRDDYLVSSKLVDETLFKSEDDYGLHLFEKAKPTDLKRALVKVGKLQDSETKRMKHLRNNFSYEDGCQRMTWQYQYVNGLNEELKWTISGHRQKFIDTNKKENDPTKYFMVVYPDLFQEDDFGFMNARDALEDQMRDLASSRWKNIKKVHLMNDISSVLPLLAAMGAHTTPHLHSGVTHVLCHLKSSEPQIWRPGASNDIFSDQNRAAFINSRLLALTEVWQDMDVTLVSPAWVRKQWI